MGVKPHGYTHGQALLEQIMEQRFKKQAESEVTVDKKRVRTSDLQTILVETETPRSCCCGTSWWTSLAGERA